MAEVATPSSAGAVPAAAGLSARLPGGPAVWIFMSVEWLTFTMFLIGHAAMRSGDPAGHDTAAALVHRDLGAINTVVLLLASWAAARAVLANRGGKPGRWWLATAGLGAVFCAVKLSEYADILGQGISLSTHDFWFAYLFLTFLHWLHVLAGVVFALWVHRAIGKGEVGPEAPLAVEAGAAYWHFVDLIWLLLFPTFYLLGGAA